MIIKIKNMKFIYAILACLIISSCSTARRVKSKEIAVKESVTVTNSIKDSVSEIVKTRAIENETQFSIKDLAKQEGDFKTTLNSGPGAEFIIEKIGDMLKIRNKIPETVNSTIKTSETKEEFHYTGEYVYKEIKTLIRRIPFRFWVYLILGLIIYFRKFIAECIVILFPMSNTTRIIGTILGNRKKT